MAKERLNLEPEVLEILKCIDSRQNFLLSGGAGSGKTYSLIQCIRAIFEEEPSSKIACITYTNAAVKEIKKRINHKNLFVSTIHDFLWDSIKSYQKELKKCIVDLANDEETVKINIEGIKEVPDNYFDELGEKIQYKDYLRIKSGIISHDEILLVANCLFKKYSKLRRIITNKFRCVLIDEYQDTDNIVVNIFLEYLEEDEMSPIVGFFGDSMQSIYDGTVKNLNTYLDEADGKIVEIKKVQNRRNPKLIIDLANKIRTDGLVQQSSGDSSAPNVNDDGVLKVGDIKFIYSENSDVDAIRKFLTDEYAWDFSNPTKTKELNLTHNLIAGKAGFSLLMDIYDKERIIELKGRVAKEMDKNNIDLPENASFGDAIEASGISINPTTVLGRFIDENQELYDKARALPFSEFRKIYIEKDNLVDDKKREEGDEDKPGSERDDLIKHLFKIENNIFLYNNKKFNQFLRVTDYKIRKVDDKKALSRSISELTYAGTKTIGEVVEIANNTGICLIDDSFNKFKREKGYIYDRVKDIPYVEFRNLYNYLEGKTPFSTQHKTKGSEYDDVFVILDNGKWNHYNFEKLFVGGGSESVLERTQKIFYVCCTRAKERLVVFFHNPSVSVVSKAKEWFGEDNVLRV